jgi:hypothetical protein
MNRQSLCVAVRASMLFAVVAVGSSVGYSGERPTTAAQIIDVKKIWSEAPHSAFTDLIRWQDRWYCAFREGDNHVGSRGNLRIITSTDGEMWQSAATLEDPEYDLRDANLSIMPDGKLMAVGGAQVAQGTGRKTGTFASYSENGTDWTTPALILPLGRWMWGVTWHDGTAWGVRYGAPDRKGINSLMASHNGRNFRAVVDEMFVEGDYPTEARIRFGQNNHAYCLQRCDGQPNLAYIGTAKPPYHKWKWKCLERYVGGPNLLQLPSGKWIAAGRLLDRKGPRTALLALDVEKGEVTPVLDLPSGGDCSYPGLVWHGDRLWMSYYSSHEDRASIYLAQIEIASEPVAQQ